MRYILLLLPLLFLSCKGEDRHLDIYFMKENSLTSFSTPCFMVNPPSNGSQKVEIADEEFVQNFALLFNKLKDSKETRGINTRIRILYHHGVETDTICMGSYFTIFVNGQLKEDSPAFLKYIKDRIYRK